MSKLCILFYNYIHFVSSVLRSFSAQFPSCPFFFSPFSGISGTCLDLKVWLSSSCSLLCEHPLPINSHPFSLGLTIYLPLGRAELPQFFFLVPSTPSLLPLPQVSFMPLVLINDPLYLGYLCVVCTSPWTLNLVLIGCCARFPSRLLFCHSY